MRNDTLSIYSYYQPFLILLIHFYKSRFCLLSSVIFIQFKELLGLFFIGQVFNDISSLFYFV